MADKMRSQITFPPTLCAAFRGDAAMLTAARQEVRANFEVRRRGSNSGTGDAQVQRCSCISAFRGHQTQHLCIHSTWMCRTRGK